MNCCTELVWSLIFKLTSIELVVLCCVVSCCFGCFRCFIFLFFILFILCFASYLAKATVANRFCHWLLFGWVRVVATSNLSKLFCLCGYKFNHSNCVRNSIIASILAALQTNTHTHPNTAKENILCKRFTAFDIHNNPATRFPVVVVAGFLFFILFSSLPLTSNPYRMHHLSKLYFNFLVVFFYFFFFRFSFRFVRLKQLPSARL